MCVCEKKNEKFIFTKYRNYISLPTFEAVVGRHVETMTLENVFFCFVKAVLFIDKFCVYM